MRPFGLAAFILLNLAVTVHLAGGLLPSLGFLAFLSLFLLPLLLVVMGVPALSSLPADLRLASAAALVVATLVPWFFLRKATGSLLAVDVLSSCVLMALAMRNRGRLRELAGVLSHLQVWLFGVIPVLFAASWLGWAVLSGREIRFYGLFAIDFGNLVSIVSTVRVSPLLPELHVVGGGPLPYHWFYFTIPALLSDFMGCSIPAANALILVNWLLAVVLFTSVVAMVRWFRGAELANAAAAVVLFAPSSVYLYQVAARHLNLGWFELPVRNHLLLSPINSALVFGNNTFALVLATLVMVFAARWRHEGSLADAFFCAGFLALITGYSITLVFPIAAAIALYAPLCGVRRGGILLVVCFLVGGAGTLFLGRLGLFGEGGGRMIAVLFDRGQFLRMVLFGMMPLWFAAFLGIRETRQLPTLLAVVTCILVPSFVYLAGSPTGAVDFSMKSGSLIPILLAPAVAGGLARSRRVHWMGIMVVLMLMLGVLHTAVYVGQFPFYRLQPIGARAESIPEDYFQSLQWLRRNTAPDSVVFDGESVTHDVALYTTMIAERRVWLPTPYTRKLGGRPVGEGRLQEWSSLVLENAGADESPVSRGEIQYLLVRSAWPPAGWTIAFRSGGVIVCEPRLQVRDK